jgi:predicted anti-sigma-YlaC factor YlaD
MQVFLTLLPMLGGGNSNQYPAATLLCMEPTRVGRKLGIGVRVASGMLRDRASQTAHSIQQEAPAYAARSAQTGRAVATGAKIFGRSIWGPFAHAGGVLWLEVTGLFFALFGIFFAQGAYRMRHAWHSGADHTRLLVYAVVAVVFFYFAFSSFFRARKKEKLKRIQAQTR